MHTCTLTELFNSKFPFCFATLADSSYPLCCSKAWAWRSARACNTLSTLP